MRGEMPMIKIPQKFMDQFIVGLCSKCGLEHAPIRTCDEALEFHEFNKETR